MFHNSKFLDVIRFLFYMQVILFIQLISVWYLQHAYVAKSLSDEYNIHPAELSGIRDRFEKYDENLSGDMPANMVAYLLQDMGEYYTPEEVQFLKTTELDADNLGVVEFPEVIRWWCSN
jgi:Ca2+-binding EF-hand superfamily protein